VTNNEVFSRQRADKKRNVIDFGACVCVGAKCQLKKRRTRSKTEMEIGPRHRVDS